MGCATSFKIRLYFLKTNAKATSLVDGFLGNRIYGKHCVAEKIKEKFAFEFASCK